jgi:hypothetical protein
MKRWPRGNQPKHAGARISVMADIKLKTYTVIDPKLSDEDKEEIKAGLDKYMVGAGQAAIGKGRAQLVGKFLELLSSMNPERVQKLEQEIKELHGMEKFERFRVQVLLLLVDVFQGGMYFALDKRALENRLDLAKVLGFNTSKESGK